MNEPASDRPFSKKPGAHGRRPPKRRAGAAAAACAAALLSPAAVQAQAGAEWTTPAGTVQGTRYSTLADIHAGNAGQLVEDFSVATDAVASHEGQPLVIGDTMYVVTPFPNKLVALDLTRPGVKRWTFDPHPEDYARGVACCDTVNRGAAYGDGKIVYNVLDTTTVAVDAVTGKQVWRTKLGDPTSGETMTGPPLIVNGKVIVGNSGGEMGVRGWVQALDLATGRPVWKAYNTGPDADVRIGADFRPFYAKDRGTDLGATSWPGSLWKQGGSTSWNWLTYDPQANLVYYGTANPGVWNPDMRPGDNKWGSSILARNPDTGAAAWAYQLTPHDGWDFDSISESIVADLTIGGVQRKVIVHFDKNGFAYTIDRRSGEVIVAEKFANATWADHIDLATGAPVVNPGMRTHQGKITENICPSPLGGKNWEPAAYSPKTGLFYVPAINLCNNMEPLKAVYIAGTPFVGISTELLPGPGTSFGELIAWDAATGRRAWSVPELLPLYGGALATAGNLVFYGTLDGRFRAIDARTGELKFEKQLECGIVGNPISYTAPDGKQRIAVYTGTGWLAGGFAGAPCPDTGGSSSDRGSGPRGAASPLADAIANLQLAKPPRHGEAAAPRSGRVYVFKLP
jgi:lanthanide-dependent methanol dehydrogenase